MTKTQTFPAFAGNAVLTLPKQPGPWRLASLFLWVNTIIGPGIGRLVNVQIKRAKVCTTHRIPATALNDGASSYITFAPGLTRVSDGAGAFNYQTNELPDIVLEPDDEVRIQMQEGDAADTIDEITAVIETA